MQVVFLTRYSFFGQSGWRSRASRDPGRLFDLERLKKRAYFFEKIALASLCSQQDQDFKLVLLSSEGLPQEHKSYLQQVCGDSLGDRAHVIFREPAPAGNRFRRYIRNHLTDDPMTLQVVLDDDDAVSTDFVKVMKAEAMAAETLFRTPEDYTYISQAQGISAVFENGTVSLTHRSVPFNTQGLGLLARTQSRRNPFFTAHKKIARRHPARVLYSQKPFYIRAVHDTNDSRAMNGTEHVTDQELPNVVERFPLLTGMFQDYKLTKAARAVHDVE